MWVRICIPTNVSMLVNTCIRIHKFAPETPFSFRNKLFKTAVEFTNVRPKARVNWLLDHWTIRTSLGAGVQVFLSSKSVSKMNNNKIPGRYCYPESRNALKRRERIQQTRAGLDSGRLLAIRFLYAFSTLNYTKFHRLQSKSWSTFRIKSLYEYLVEVEPRWVLGFLVGVERVSHADLFTVVWCRGSR